VKPIEIGGRKIGADGSIFVIAEIANAHEGNADRACQLVRAAAIAGAHAVKVQKFTSDELVVSHDPRYEHFKKMELTEPEWARVAQTAREAGLPMLADVFDERSANLMDRLGAAAFKIHSTDLLNPSLVEHVARKGKPMLLSTGGSTLGEIRDAILRVRQAGADQIVLMHGFQNFPTHIEDHNLRLIRTLQEMFRCWVGFQDHTDADLPVALTLPMVAAAFGAVVIEKHITLDRSLRGIDYYSSLNPSEFAQMVSDLQTATRAFGSGEGDLSASEIEYRQKMKKTIVARTNIAPGQRITRDALAFKRAGKGLLPTEAERLLGLVAKVAIEKDHAILMSELTAQVAICIAVRLHSTRLPNKALIQIEGQTAIEHLIDRLVQSRTAAAVILCTSTNPQDKPLIDIARKKGIKWYAGSENDVMDRFLQAAATVNADVIVRVTGDDILVDPHHLDLLVRRHIEAGADYSCCPGLPKGTECEAISTAALRKAHELAEDPNHSEYMTWYLKRDDIFRVQELQVDEQFRRDYRLTLDCPEDLAVLKEVFRNLHRPGETFSLAELIRFLDAHPEVTRMNRNVKPRKLGKEVNTRLRTPHKPEPSQSATLEQSGYTFAGAEEPETATVAAS
jgi:N,N'-diacetyllegionaminate synthase